MDELWTRTDGIPDSGQVDMGVHYPLPKPLLPFARISMPSSNFTPGDICSCDVTVTNFQDVTIQGYPLFVILGVWGTYFFAPGFGEFDYYTHNFPAGKTTIQVLPEFTWPSGVGSADSIIWYTALTNPEMTLLVSNLGLFEFGWSE